MAHNTHLPTHRYVWVREDSVLNQPSDPVIPKLIPAVWLGISSQPGRAIGCQVLLECGALVLDLPLHALAHTELVIDSEWVPVSQGRQAWDAFGWDVEVFEVPFLSGLDVEVLGQDPGDGVAWFAIDWVRNGYSEEPGQHKWLWVVARNDGWIGAYPQDKLLFRDASFTEGPLPEGGIKRQTEMWSAEDGWKGHI